MYLEQYGLQSTEVAVWIENGWITIYTRIYYSLINLDRWFIIVFIWTTLNVSKIICTHFLGIFFFLFFIFFFFLNTLYMNIANLLHLDIDAILRNGCSDVGTRIWPRLALKMLHKPYREYWRATTFDCVPISAVSTSIYNNNIIY